MMRATSVVRRSEVAGQDIADWLTLDHGARHRRRMAMTGDSGLSFLLDLDRAAVLDDGDALRLEDGRLIAVKAASERLIEIRTGNPLRLMQVAWHLGNRHVPTELTHDAIYIAEEHVLIEMVRGLGASATLVERPFRPERGAYEAQGGYLHGGHSHDYDHHHGNDHHHHDDHRHGHEHGHHQEHDHLGDRHGGHG
jgi:urease accessory protein